MKLEKLISNIKIHNKFTVRILYVVNLDKWMNGIKKQRYTYMVS